MNLFYRKLLGMELAFLRKRIEYLESIAEGENDKPKESGTK